MARAYLKWSADTLAKTSGVALSTVKRVEQEDGHSNTRINNLVAIRDTLLATGKIRFEGDSCVRIAE